MEPEGAVPGGPGVSSAEPGSARCSQVPAETASVHASHQQHSRAGHRLLQGETAGGTTTSSGFTLDCMIFKLNTNVCYVD